MFNDDIIDIDSVVATFNFRVSEENIHMDLTTLPSAIFNAGQLVANTRQSLDDLKRQLSVLESTHDSAIRNNPLKYEIAKITEGAVTATIDKLADVQALREKIIRAKHANDVAYAAVSALTDKRKSLESLVQLKSIGYYAARNVA